MSKQSTKKSEKKRTKEEVADFELPKTPKKKKKKAVQKENNYEDLDDGEIEMNNFEFEEAPLKEKHFLNPIKNDLTDDNWTTDDYKELIKRMEDQIPKNDTKSFLSRAEKLDWSQIQFGSHSIEECYEGWKVLKSKVRHFRLLKEVLHDAKIWTDNPWTTQRNSKKKNRHPDQPTRPLSSYMLFYMDKKEKVMKKNPNAKLTDISRLLGERYKALSETKKNYYVQKAAYLQEEYKIKLQEFYKNHPELKPVAKQPINKKPLTPFKLFLNDNLKKHQYDEGFSKDVFMDKCKQDWKNLSSKKKAAWIRLAKEEEDKFLRHLEESSEAKTEASYKSVVSKDENAILDRLAGKPEKPPNSAYSLFSKLMLQDKDIHFVEGEPKTRMKEVANKWKLLPAEKKREYEEELKHMVENYKLEFANYLDSLPEEKKAEELAKQQTKNKTNKLRQKESKKTTKPGKSLFKNEPEKPPVTAWDLYKNEFLKKNSNLTSKEAFRQAAEQWKKLPKKETEKYKKKHELLRAKYMRDYQAFLSNFSEEELTEFSKLKAQNKEQTVEESADESSSKESVSGFGSGSDSSAESDSGVSEEED